MSGTAGLVQKVRMPNSCPSQPFEKKTVDVSKALRGYEPRVTAYADQLLEEFKNKEGKPINVSEWFNFYSFDVMGDLAWGKSFGMLRDGIKHYFMVTLHGDMKNVGLFSHLVWLFPIFKAIPILNSEHKMFWKWINTQVAERKQVCEPQPYSSTE